MYIIMCYMYIIMCYMYTIMCNLHTIMCDLHTIITCHTHHITKYSATPFQQLSGINTIQGKYIKRPR